MHTHIVCIITGSVVAICGFQPAQKTLKVAVLAFAEVLLQGSVEHRDTTDTIAVVQSHYSHAPAPMPLSRLMPVRKIAGHG